MAYQIAILTTTFNPEVIDVMVTAAQDEAKGAGVESISVTKTLGCLDMPVIAQYLLKQPQVDAVVVLGAVAQGETQHDELVVNTMTQKIVDLSVDHDKPVGFGVIGPGARPEHFMPRANEYARRAVRAVIQNLEILGN